MRPVQRLPFLLLGFIALFLGVAVGLTLIGWALPWPRPSLILQHGALMICGFFGLLIGLERATALDVGWTYLGPAAAGVGTLVLWFGDQNQLAALLYFIASLILTGASLSAYRKQPAFFAFTLVLAAFCWVIGNLAWLVDADPHQVRLWWLMFLVLTIAGERLELSRFLAPPASAQRWFAAILVALLLSLMLGFWRQVEGSWALAISLLLLTLWLARFDIARRTVRAKGLTRYIAVCLLSAYGWLAVASLAILVSGGFQLGTLSSDAALHAITLGFVFGMVFGHMPIILPSLLRVKVPYHPLFYGHFALLQISLMLRILGDLISVGELRTWGGLLNALALGLFLLVTLGSILVGRVSKSVAQ